MFAIVLSHTFDEYKVVQVISCFDTAFAGYPFFNAIPIDVIFLVLYQIGIIFQEQFWFSLIASDDFHGCDRYERTVVTRPVFIHFVLSQI